MLWEVVLGLDDRIEGAEDANDTMRLSSSSVSSWGVFDELAVSASESTSDAFVSSASSSGSLSVSDRTDTLEKFSSASESVRDSDESSVSASVSATVLACLILFRLLVSFCILFRSRKSGNRGRDLESNVL